MDSNPSAFAEILVEREKLITWLEAVNPAWKEIAARITEERDLAVRELIEVENAETRGRIKALNGVLSFPANARIRINEIDEILSREAAEPVNSLID